MTDWLVNAAIAGARRSVVHLEMRDAYMLDEADLIAWRQGRWQPSTEGPWYDLIRSTVARGVPVRRARVVSEPPSEYIRFEYDSTVANLAVGEEVRWLPRRLASDIALPGNDFWLIDDDLVIFNHFDGYGVWVPDRPEEVRREPGVVKLCADAFRAVWSRAMPHDAYHLP